MLYTLYATLRNGKDVRICDWDNLPFFEKLLDNFTASDNIKCFVITKHKGRKQQIHLIKELEYKTKEVDNSGRVYSRNNL